MNGRWIARSGAVAALAVLTASAPAFAWRHVYSVWLPDDFPLRAWVADDGNPGDPELCVESGGVDSCCEESVPAGYCRQVAQQGWDAWGAAECAEWEVELQETPATNIGFAQEGRYQITFNDPNDDLAEGVLGLTQIVGIGNVFTLDGAQYSHFISNDIILADNVDFASDDEVANGECSNQINMRGVLTHEIGHSLGMGHSCEDPQKEPADGQCPNPVLREATMYWNEGPCERDAIDINEDDIEGFNALYGPYATFACSHEVNDGLAVGVVPFEIHCVVVSDSINEVTSASWNFGDGGTAADLNASHEYTEPGNYTIQLNVHGERAACGEDGWDNNYRRVGYVRACGVPEAEFEVSHVDGLKYKMLNDSDVSVYGCISNISWDVFKGDKATGTPIPDLSGNAAWEPVIEFPEAGTYTVVMSLGGIAGTGGASVTFEAKNYRGEGYGCSTVQTAGASLAGLAVLAFAARRRRSSAA